MGGAMAAVGSNVIAATKLYPGERIKLVTFGQPRTGDREFANAHDSLVGFMNRL